MLIIFKKGKESKLSCVMLYYYCTTNESRLPSMTVAESALKHSTEWISHAMKTSSTKESAQM